MEKGGDDEGSTFEFDQYLLTPLKPQARLCYLPMFNP